MPSFRDWLARVLTHGESVLDAPPVFSAAERPGVLTDLRAAFDRHALDIAGPPVGFDADVAVGAAVVFARACWLVGEADEEVRPALAVGGEPTSPAAHLSADVVFRFLPVVYRRAKRRFPEGKLTVALDGLLRRWPLSGVLADLDGEPAAPPVFGDHPGLQLLYAERLVRTGRPGWVPPAGPARDQAERIYHERDRPLPAPPPKEDPRV